MVVPHQTRPTCPSHSGFSAENAIITIIIMEEKIKICFLFFLFSICDTDIHNHGPVHTRLSGSSDVARYVNDHVMQGCAGWQFG